MVLRSRFASERRVADKKQDISRRFDVEQIRTADRIASRGYRIGEYEIQLTLGGTLLIIGCVIDRVVLHIERICVGQEVAKIVWDLQWLGEVFRPFRMAWFLSDRVDQCHTDSQRIVSE